MKISEQEICEYLFNLLSPEMKDKVKQAVDTDPEVKKEYLRLKNKFDRLNLLEADYPNPLSLLTNHLIKHSAIAAVLLLVCSLWFLPSQVHAENFPLSMEAQYEVPLDKKVFCTSGISPQESLRFDKNLNEILAKNIQLTSSIDSEMNYSTQYLKKLSL